MIAMTQVKDSMLTGGGRSFVTMGKEEKGYALERVVCLNDALECTNDAETIGAMPLMLLCCHVELAEERESFFVIWFCHMEFVFCRCINPIRHRPIHL